MNRCSAHKIDNCSGLFHLSPFAILDCAFILLLLVIILIRYVSKKPSYNAFWHFFLVSIFFGCSKELSHSDGAFEYPQQIYVLVVK